MSDPQLYQPCACSLTLSYKCSYEIYIKNVASNGLILLLPKVFKAFGGQLGVPRRMLDVAVAEPLLNGSRVMAIVGQLKSTGMAQHVRVDREGELGRRADARELLAEAGRGHRRQALGGEHVGRGRHLLTVQATQRAQLAAAQDVRRRPTLLETADVHEALVEVDHVPAQADQLGDAQAVPVGDEDHGAVAVGVAAEAFAAGLIPAVGSPDGCPAHGPADIADLSGVTEAGITQALYLLAGQELARPQLGVGAPWRRECPIYSGRGTLSDGGFGLAFHRASIHECPIYGHKRTVPFTKLGTGASVRPGSIRRSSTTCASSRIMAGCRGGGRDRPTLGEGTPWTRSRASSRSSGPTRPWPANRSRSCSN